MTDMGIGIDPGPRPGAGLKFGLDPRDSERLLVDHQARGCGFVLGVGLLLSGLSLQAVGLLNGVSWGALSGGIVLGVFGALMAFGRFRTVFDRREKHVEHAHLLGAAVIFRRESMEQFDKVVISEKVDVNHEDDGQTSYATTFKVVLVGTGRTMQVASAGLWENAVPVAEALSRFLEIPLHDRAADRIRQPDELDESLREQRRRHSLKPAGARPPAEQRCTIDDEAGAMVVNIPRPDGRPMVGLLLIVIVLWALPVGLLSRSFFVALLPVVVVLASWIKVAYGYSSTIDARPELLRIRTRGLVIRRTVEIPTDELENLAVRQFEWGGPRNTLAHMLDGFLVARSDNAAIRFGHGLSTQELVWLRARLLEVVTSPRRAPTKPSSSARRRLQTKPAWSPVPLIGMALGAAGAHLLGGPFAICVDLPFLEHVVNVGGLLGYVAAKILIRDNADDGAWTAVVWASTGIVVLVVAALIPDAEWVQLRPSADEAALLRLGPRPAGFWVAWMGVGARVNALLAGAALFIAARVVRRFAK